MGNICHASTAERDVQNDSTAAAANLYQVLKTLDKLAPILLNNLAPSTLSQNLQRGSYLPRKKT